MSYKTKFNPFTKKLQWVVDELSLVGLTFKDGVPTYNNLPVLGNAKNDSRITNDNHHLYIWDSDSSSGTLANWIDQGDIIDIGWGSITGKPSSTPVNIDDAVAKKHTQNSDTKLAEGTVDEITANETRNALDVIIPNKIDKVVGGIDANTLVNLHFDGLDGAITTVDSSDYNNNVTMVGQAVLDDAVKKFGTTSLYLDGDISNGIRVEKSLSNNFNFGSNNFTFDFWINVPSYPINSNDYTLFTLGNTVTNDKGLFAKLTYRTDLMAYHMQFNFNADGFSTDTYYSDLGDFPLILNTWHHIAVERYGNILYFYFDGNKIHQNILIHPIMISDPLDEISIGSGSQSGNGLRFVANIDEFRVSNIARYQGQSFTPQNNFYSKIIDYLSAFNTDGSLKTSGISIDYINKSVISEASGDYKKVTKIQYNPLTQDIKIEYET